MMVGSCLDSGFLSALGKLPDPVLLADDDRRCLFANCAAAALLGVTEERIIGMRIDDFVPEWRDVESEWQAFLENGHSQGALCFKTPQGAMKHFEFTAIANVFPSLHVSFIRDVSEQRQAELQREQMQQLAELAMNAGRMGCWRWFSFTGETTVNTGFKELFDIPPESTDFSYEHFLKRVHPDDLQPLRELLGQTLYSGERYQTQYRVVRTDGSIRWVVDRGQVLFDSEGNRVGISGVAWDTTEQRLQEQERAKHLRELARSNLDLERFAHVASHDLKEPLRDICALSELLVRQSASKLDLDEREVLEMIVASSKRMAGLIDSMLAYARTGLRGELVKRLIPAERIVEDALANLRLVMKQSDAIIEVGELPIISCSPSDLALVFQNLVSNAAKYCEARPEIRIAAERETDAWLFSVRDNGIGIDPIDREKIFEMFTRLHTNAYPGTGAGLAICKTIIEKHGGRIWVQSEKGHGSTFFFTVPF